MTAVFGNRFKLTAPWLERHIGWMVLQEAGHQVSLNLDLPDGADDNFSTAFTSALFSPRSQGAKRDLPGAVPRFAEAASPTLWDVAAQVLAAYGKKNWQPRVPGPRINIATGKPASIGQLDPSGKVGLSAPDSSVAGISIPVTPAIAVGKNYRLCSVDNVHLEFLLDPDTLKKSHPNFWLLDGGAAVNIKGKTSSGDPLQLRIGIGRGTTGGPASFTTIQISF